MTLERLSVYYRLHTKLQRNLAMLESFANASPIGAQVMTGMPHAPGVSDKVGALAIEIADLEARNKQLRRDMEAEKLELDRFISTIEDDQTRMIYRLRFLHCLSWSEVAEVVGGRNTEWSVKSICYRYLKSVSE